MWPYNDDENDFVSGKGGQQPSFHIDTFSFFVYNSNMKPKILILYPNIPLMMTPSISIGLFTTILKNEGCSIDIFETTGYSDDYGGMASERVKIGGTRAFEFKDLFSTFYTNSWNS